MILLVIAAIALVVALARGGDLRALADVPIRHGYLAILAVVTQIVIFSSAWASSSLAPYAPYAYVVSMLLLLAAVGLNWRLPGLFALGLGLLANTFAIALNGGRMPASPAALETAGLSEAFTQAGALGSTANSTLLGPATRVPFLCDIFAVPSWFPLQNVFSAGDVLIALGAAWFFLATLRPRAKLAAKR